MLQSTIERCDAARSPHPSQLPLAPTALLPHQGRTFLIYELEIKIKWEGELRDGDGGLLESTKGSIKLPDVSAEVRWERACDRRSYG